MDDLTSWDLNSAGEKGLQSERPNVKRRTSRKKLRGAVARFTEWIKEERHGKLRDLMKTVAQKYRGHWNYYGLIDNSRSLHQYYQQTSWDTVPMVESP